ATAERREQERRRGEQARPPVPDWILESSLNRSAPPLAVHVGGCHMAGKRWKAVPRDVALRALSEGVDDGGAPFVAAGEPSGLPQGQLAASPPGAG
ncbi:DUF6233 domain-containing protein, partial [Streptomyces spiralis]